MNLSKLNPGIVAIAVPHSGWAVETSVLPWKDKIMIELNDLDYYRARILASRELARQATMPEVGAIHTELAFRYAALVVQIEQASTARQSRSGSAAQPPVQVVFIESGNL